MTPERAETTGNHTGSGVASAWLDKVQETKWGKWFYCGVNPGGGGVTRSSGAHLNWKAILPSHPQICAQVAVASS